MERDKNLLDVPDHVVLVQRVRHEVDSPKAGVLQRMDGISSYSIKAALTRVILGTNLKKLSYLINLQECNHDVKKMENMDLKDWSERSESPESMIQLTDVDIFPDLFQYPSP